VIRAAAGLAWVVATLGSSPAAAQPPADAAPCATCTVISLTPSQVAAAPSNLAGSRLLIRIRAGDAAATWTPSLADLRRQGGRVGLHVIGVPAEDDPALEQAGEALVIELEAADRENLAFRLKGAFARARGANDNSTLVLAEIGRASCRERV